MNKHITYIYKSSLTLILFLTLGVPFHSVFGAGSLFLSPASGVYVAGTTFGVDVRVNTNGVPINAAEGGLTFNKDEVSVVSVSETGSIFNLWTVEPTFSNSAGTITFGGGSPKGYTGSAGQVMRIIFKALKSATAKVAFNSGVILAADGQGTNIISDMVSGIYTLSSTQIEPKIEYVAPVNTPEVGTIDSSTHPVQTEWYPLKDAELSWTVADKVTEMRTLVDQKSNSIPTVYYSKPFASKKIENLDEGTWYFHIQMKNSYGWGKVTHFRINVDSEKPTHLNLSLAEHSETDSNLKLVLDAEDKTSGIGHYMIGIDGGEEVSYQDDGSHAYPLTGLTPGKHTVFVKAFDKAKNYLADSFTFTVSALSAPEFTDYAPTLTTGSLLVLRGKALPNASVVVKVSREGIERTFTVTTDSTGAFVFIDDKKSEDGVYTVTGVTIDKSGGRSNESSPIRIAVAPSGILRIGTYVLTALSVVIPLIGIIIALIVVGLWTKHRFTLWKKRLGKEITEAEKVLHEEFKLVKEGLARHVTSLEGNLSKRKATKDEEAMLKDVKDLLDKAERKLDKEIMDIEKEL